MEQKFYSTVEAASLVGIQGAPSSVGKTFRRLAAKFGLVPTKEKGALCWTEADIAEVKANYKPRAKRTATVEDVTTAQVGEPTNAPVVEETATVETVDVPPANTDNTIDMTLYNTFMLWAEKISNGQHDAVYPFVAKLKEVFAFDADKEEIIDAIKTDDLNGARRYLAQIDFVVKDDAGYLHKLTATHGDEYVLGDMPADVTHENVLAYVTPATATNDAEDSGKTITPAVAETASVTAVDALPEGTTDKKIEIENRIFYDTTNGGAVQQVISAEDYKKIDVAAKMVAFCKQSDTLLETELKDNNLLADNYAAFAEELKATKDYKTEYKACLQRYLDQFNVIVAEPVKTEPPAQKPVVDAEPFISCYAPEPAKPEPAEPEPAEPAPVEVKEPVKPSEPKPAPMDNFVRTQDRIKSCPVNLRLPDDFIFGEDGIEYVIRGKKGDKYISAALTPIVPTKVFCNPINNATDYEFAILVVDGWCKVEIPGTALGDRELVCMLNGRGAIIDSPQYLNKFINAVIKLNADILPRPKSYNQTGWTSEDFNDFAFPANGKSVVRREGYDYDRILRPHGDREEWKKKFGEVVKQGGAYAKTIIGFACAAFLVRPLGLPNIQLHVHGRKSIGKTPTEQFAVSPFGDPTIHGLSYSFASTPKARLEMATAFRDFPMICEELESIGKREAEKIPQDVYQFFMGTSGQALKKDGTKRESKNFSGARLTSGEHSLVQSFGNAGEFKRVLELRCNTLLDEEFASDLYEFCAKNHGLFLEDWTRYIIEHQGQISKGYHQLLKYICADQKDNGTERDRTQLATLVISTVAYQHFKICVGLQANFDHREFECVTNAVAMEMQSAEELDDTTRALAFLKSFIAGSDKYFIRTITDPETRKREEIAQYTADCYGKIFDSGDIAFLPHALKKILEEHGGFASAEKLINEFKAKDYLRGNDEKTTYPCRIRGKLVRTVRFKAAVFGIEDTDTDITRGGACYTRCNKV